MLNYQRVTEGNLIIGAKQPSWFINKVTSGWSLQDSHEEGSRDSVTGSLYRADSTPSREARTGDETSIHQANCARQPILFNKVQTMNPMNPGDITTESWHIHIDGTWNNDPRSASNLLVSTLSTHKKLEKTAWFNNVQGIDTNHILRVHRWWFCIVLRCYDR